MSYRAHPEKEKMRTPPGPWMKFIEMLAVVTVTLWLIAVNGFCMYRAIKYFIPGSAGEAGPITFVLSVVFGIGALMAVASFGDRRDW